MAVSDIIIAPATLYTAPVGTAIPDEHTIGFGTAWPVAWINVGYTLAPISISYSADLFGLEVEQVTVEVKRLRTKETLTLETTLAELTGANLNYLVDGTLTTAAASATVRANERVEAGGKTDVSERMWGFEGLFRRDGSIALPVRFFIYRANAILNGKLEFAKKSAAGLPLQVQGLLDDSKLVGRQLFLFQRVTAKKTGEV
jgi:hypothetical protein